MATSPTSRRGFLRRGRKGEAGFTILEVSMATFVMAFGIATTIIAMQSGFKSLDVDRDTTLASQIIQSEVERLRLMSWSGISALPASETVSLSTMFTTNTEITSRFTATRTVGAVSDPPASTGWGWAWKTWSTDDMKEITIAVSWKGYDQRSHSLSMVTYYAKNGLYDYLYTLARP